MLRSGITDERKAERSNAENAWGGEDMSNELTHNPGQFDEVIHIIDNARSRAMKAVNAELDVLERRCVFVRALFCIKLWR